MIINLKSLNESLEKKELIESRSINEAFDESFPKWLKDRILVVKQANNSSWSVPRDQRPAYKNTRTGEDAYASSAEKSLFNKSLKKGIDFSQTKVIEGPIPEKRTDPRLKAPNIPIWLFDNGQVYIEGVNENEKYLPTGKPFQYMSMKEKLAEAKAFAYIDGSSLDKDFYDRKKADRARMQQEIQQIGETNPSSGIWRKGDPEKFFPEDIMYDTYSRLRNPDYAEARGFIDKSGYPIHPKRYENDLKKAGAKKVFDVLQGIYDRIIEVRDDIAAATSYIDPLEDMEGYRSLRGIMGVLRDAIESYNYYSERAKHCSEQFNSGRWAQDRYLEELGDLSSQVKADERLQALKTAGNDIFMAGVDWLE